MWLHSFHFARHTQVSHSCFLSSTSTPNEFHFDLYSIISKVSTGLGRCWFMLLVDFLSIKVEAEWPNLIVINIIISCSIVNHMAYWAMHTEYDGIIVGRVICSNLSVWTMMEWLTIWNARIELEFTDYSPFAVGKTSLITRFMYDSFDNTYQVSTESGGGRKGDFMERKGLWLVIVVLIPFLYH